MKLPSFNPHVFAINWCKAWNARDLDALLSHYADSIEVCPLHWVLFTLGLGSGQGLCITAGKLTATAAVMMIAVLQPKVRG